MTKLVVWTLVFIVAVAAAFIAARRLRGSSESRASKVEELSGREAISADFAADAAGRNQFFFYVKIPGNLGPLERDDRFGDPLNEALTAAGLGEVTGGGSQLAAGGGIEYCGLDVDAVDHDRALALVIQTMRNLKAPPGTTVEEYRPAKRSHPVYGG